MLCTQSDSPLLHFHILIHSDQYNYTTFYVSKGRDETIRQERYTCSQATF